MNKKSNRQIPNAKSKKRLLQSQDFKSHTPQVMEKIVEDDQNSAHGEEDSVWERLLTEPQSDAGSRIVATP